MSFRVVECEMSGETVLSRRIVAGAALSQESAEAIAVRLAQSHSEAGFNGQGGYWWARDGLGRDLRFTIELSPFDETDGV
jgi:hypothetical protein